MEREAGQQPRQARLHQVPVRARSVRSEQEWGTTPDGVYVDDLIITCSSAAAIG
jgi:hypothetical protein